MTIRNLKPVLLKVSRAACVLAMCAYCAACSGGHGGSPTYTVGGMVSGLAGTGLVLQNNAGGDLAVSAGGSFVFASQTAAGGAYAVTVKTQPSSPWQTCTAADATGTVANADVTNIAVTCVTNTYKVHAKVSGLAGSGLILEDNTGDDLAVSADGTLNFATVVASGGAYDVSVKVQPAAVSQTCTAAASAGTVTNADVSVTVTCVTNGYTVGGTVTGLAGSGLTLQDNGADTLSIAAGGSFKFAHPIQSGTAYSVSVSAQPGNPTQVCSVAGATGGITNANVGNVTVTCTTPVVQCGSENGTIVMHAANVTTDQTWAGNGTVHMVTNSISILAPATLTIQKCAIVKLKAGVQIVVDGDPSGGVAKLLVAGDDPSTGRVFFQSADTNQFWGSLVGVNKNSLIELNYAVILGGGNNGGAARNATISMTGSSTLPDPVLRINYVAIGGMQGAGIYLNNAAFTSDSSELGIVGSPDYSIALSAMALGSIPTYTGTSNAHDEALVVNNSNIFDNLTIHNRLPIHFKTDGIRVAGSAPTFVPNITLTLDAGVVIKIEPPSTSPPMIIFGTNGQTTDENAALVANGTAALPVVFTSGAATPAPGDWAGIWLLTSNGSQLTNVTIEYAGGDANIAPQNCGALDPVHHQQVRHTAALLVGDGTDMQYVPPGNLITSSTFQNNAGNYAIDSVWETTGFGPSLKGTNTFTSPGLSCPQSKNLIPLGCTVAGVDESGCMP
jgi:hypothetical protein